MKYIICIITLIFTVNGYTQECLDLKNGKFKYLDDENNEVIINRLDSIQIDSYKDIGFSYKSKIKWLSECEYQMTIYEVSNSYYEALIETIFKVKIIDINNNLITCQTSSKKRSVQSIMQKID